MVLKEVIPHNSNQEEHAMRCNNEIRIAETWSDGAAEYWKRALTLCCSKRIVFMIPTGNQWECFEADYIVSASPHL